MAHAPPGSRLRPMGAGHFGQRGDSSDEAVGQFDSVTQPVAPRVSLLFLTVPIFICFFRLVLTGQTQW